MLDPEALQRLIKFAGMLGSDHAGERAAAALKCTELLAAHRTTWAEVLKPVNGRTVVQTVVVTEPAPLHRTWKTVVTEIADHYLELLESDREESFIESMLFRYRPATPKQLKWLGDICDRIGVKRWQ